MGDMTREQMLEAALRDARHYLRGLGIGWSGAREVLDNIDAALAMPATAQRVDVASWEAGRDAARRAVACYLMGVTDYDVSGRDQDGLDAVIRALTPPADIHAAEVLRLRESEAALVRALKSVAADIKEYLADDTGTIALECALETIYRALADKDASHDR